MFWPWGFLSSHIGASGRMVSVSTFKMFLYRQIYCKGNISLYCFIARKWQVGKAGQFMLLLIHYSKRCFLLMHVCFNKRHRERYNLNICDYSQNLAKICRKVLECIKGGVYHLCFHTLFFTTPLYKCSKDKPEKPVKLIPKHCSIICGFYGNLWAQFMVQYPISLIAVLLQQEINWCFVNGHLFIVIILLLSFYAI